MGDSTTGRVVRALLAGTCLLLGTVMVGAAPASGESPTVTVTPSTTVHGGTVTITTSGFPSGLHAFLQCPASFADTDGRFVLSNCAFLSDLRDSVPLPSFDATVRAVFATSDGSRTVDCAAEPGGCIVGVLVASVDATPTHAWAPISFFPGLVAEPNRGLGDGHTVTVTGEGFPDGERSIAQCTRGYAATQDPSQATSLCGPATGVAVVDGAFSVDRAVHEPLVAVDGSTHPCGHGGCVLVMSSATTSVETVAALSFGPPSLTIDTPGPLRGDQAIAITLAGLPGQQAVVRQCAEPVDADRCDAGTGVTLGSLGNWTGDRAVTESVQSTGGPVYSCLDEQCVLVAFVGDVPVASAPLDFAPRFGITLYPSGALLDGQAIGVDVAGLRPGSSYTLLQCAGSCDELGTFTAGPEGTLDVTVTVSQRVGETDYCRDNCQIGLVFEYGLRTVGFTMAPGEIDVTPSEGLSDGQPVAVSGTDLMPTYAGPALGPFPTGSWALAQCDAAVGDRPDLYGTFDHCTVLPTPGPVVIDDSTYDETVGPRASITTILGRTVDCGAAPGACVVGLLRFEQDASVSAHLAPVTFAGT